MKNAFKILSASIKFCSFPKRPVQDVVFTEVLLLHIFIPLFVYI